MSTLDTYRHLIPEAQVCAEEVKITAALIEGGYDPQELPLNNVAVSAILRDLDEDARRVGIPIQDRHYAFTPDGDVEVVFRLEAKFAPILKLTIG